MLSRRHFLKQASAYTVGFAGLHAFISCAPRPTVDPYTQANGYGPLQVDPAGIFDLPDGFLYRIISRVGDPMDDGLFVPRRTAPTAWRRSLVPTDAPSSSATTK